MKISDVLGFMGVQFTIRGDQDYTGSINLADIDADWPDGMPTDEFFHESAEIYAQKLLSEENRAKKLSEYPDIYDCVLALIEQVTIILDATSINMSDKFIDIKTKIEEANKRYE